MQVIPYLYFNGNAQDAIQFYQRTFKASEPVMMRYKDQPSPELLPEHQDMILHAELVVGNATFYISDAVGSHQVKIGDNLQINLNCESEEEINWIYNHLREAGHVRMELQDTFWGALFGTLTDQYGITWSLNYQRPQA